MGGLSGDEFRLGRVQDMRMRLTVFTCVLLAIVMSTPARADSIALSTSDSRFTAGVFNQGWWMADNAASGNSNVNTNYFTGFSFSTEFRSFFTFDLRHVALATQAIIGASLVVNSADYAGDSSLGETLGLFDVTTPAAVLNNNTGSSTAIFTDLGAGTTYGTYEVPRVNNAPLTFALNAAAFADIAANAGSFFSIGGRLLSGSASSEVDGIFSGSGFRPASLILQTEPLAVSPTPEPASILLIGSGLLGLIASGRRRT
ncbi:MAG: hypothetical protein DMG04_28980 [Acidobacteria bacterium]|nr:MAG: hypothetical protein DMG04_28980 [Acidobacteriota bacterium]